MNARAGAGWTRFVLVAAALASGPGCNRPPGSSQVERQSSASTTTTHTITLETPRSVPVRSVAVGAKGNVSLGPSSRVEDLYRVMAVATNVGASGFQIGSRSVLGDVWSAGAVGLGSEARLRGRLHAATVTSGPGVVVEGGIDPSPTITPHEVLSWTSSSPGHLSTSRWPSGQSSAPNPGRHGTIRAHRTQLHPHRGLHYFIDTLPAGAPVPGSFSIGPEARSCCTCRPVVLMRPTISVSAPVGATAPDLLVAFCGTTGVVLDQPFTGTFLAPRTLLQGSTSTTATLT